MDTIAKYKELDSLVKKVEKDFDVSYTEQVTQWGVDCKMFIRHGSHIYAMLESANYAGLKKQAQEFMNQRLTQNK